MGQSLGPQQPVVAMHWLAPAHFFIVPHEKSHAPALQTGVPPGGAMQA
jgi:hypothetical protein